MKKGLLSILTIIISIFTLCSCGLVSKTPTSVVNDYVKDFKQNLDNDISKSIISAISSSNNQEEVNRVKETLRKSLSNLKVEVKEETLEDNFAAVKVDVTGVSLEKVKLSLLDRLESPDFIKEVSSLSYDQSSEKITSVILELIDNAELENRTCTLNLVKDGNTYTLKSTSNELCTDFWGTSIPNLDSFKH